jgi:hypothetical protein
MNAASPLSSPQPFALRHNQVSLAFVSKLNAITKARMDENTTSDGSLCVFLRVFVLSCFRDFLEARMP